MTIPGSLYKEHANRLYLSIQLQKATHKRCLLVNANEKWKQNGKDLVAVWREKRLQKRSWKHEHSRGSATRAPMELLLL